MSQGRDTMRRKLIICWLIWLIISTGIILGAQEASADPDTLIVKMTDTALTNQAINPANSQDSDNSYAEVRVPASPLNRNTPDHDGSSPGVINNVYLEVEFYDSLAFVDDYNRIRWAFCPPLVPPPIIGSWHTLTNRIGAGNEGRDSFDVTSENSWLWSNFTFGGLCIDMEMVQVNTDDAITTYVDQVNFKIDYTPAIEPTFYNYGATPTTASWSSQIDFFVTVMDAQNDALSFVYVEIDGSNRTMLDNDTTDGTTSDGKTYYYQEDKFSNTTHNFRFFASDGTNTGVTSLQQFTISSNVIVNITGNVTDGGVSCVDSTYADCLDGSGSLGADTISGSQPSGQELAGINYYVWEILFSFDTDILPDSCTVNYATIYAYAHQDDSDDNYTLNMYHNTSGSGYWANTSNPATSDYVVQPGVSNPYMIYEGDLIINSSHYAQGYYALNVQASWINLTGQTRFIGLGSRYGNTPTQGEHINFYMANQGSLIPYMLVDVTNNAPTLTYDQVAPSSGYRSTTFNFTVNYTDSDNDPPYYIYVNIDGSNYTMTKVNASDTTYTDGTDYYYTNSGYSVAVHNYRFYTSDGANATSTTTKQFTVLNQAPVITTSCTFEVIREFTYYLRAFQATDGDADPLTWSISGASWLAINSSTGIANGTTPAGFQEFVITVQVTDGMDSDSCIYQISVVETPPSGGDPVIMADFDYTIIALYKGVQFQDKSYVYGSKEIPDNIISWTWNFGDGTTSTEQNPSHIYDKPGVYLVSLTVKDNKNSTSYGAKYIFVPPISQDGFKARTLIPTISFLAVIGIVLIIIGGVTLYYYREERRTIFNTTLSVVLIILGIVCLGIVNIIWAVISSLT